MFFTSAKLRWTRKNAGKRLFPFDRIGVCVCVKPMLPSNCVYHPKFQSDRTMNSTNTNPTHNLEGHTVTRFTGNVTNVTDLFLGLCPSTFRLHLGILAAQTNRRGCLELMLAAQPPHRGGYVAAPLPGVKSAKESNRSHWVNFLGGPIIL